MICAQRPLLRDWHDADMMGLAANVARLAYGGDLAAVWSLLYGVEMDRHQGQAFTRKVPMALYLVGARTPEHPDPRARMERTM